MQHLTYIMKLENICIILGSDMLLLDSTVVLAYQKDRMYTATRVTVLNQVLTEKNLRLHRKKIQFTRVFFLMKN